MIRFLFRLVGFLCLAAAFVFAVYDGMKSIADQAVFLTRTGDVWIALNAPSQDLAQQWLAQHGVPWLWDPAALQVLQAPVWLVLTVLGGLLMFAGRRKRPLIGYARS